MTLRKASRIKPIRWAINHAASEFDIHAATLSKRIKTAGLETGKDGLFSTKQIASAVYGDIDGETLRLVREQADKIALENAERRGDLVDLPRLSEAVARQLNAIKAHLYASSLEDEDKDKLLADIRELWRGIAKVRRPDNTKLESSATSNC